MPKCIFEGSYDQLFGDLRRSLDQKLVCDLLPVVCRLVSAVLFKVISSFT